MSTSTYNVDDDDFWRAARRALGRVPALRSVLVQAAAMFFAMKDPRTPLWAKGTIGVALAYLVSPIDAIPDVLGPAGYVDDAGVLGVAWTAVDAYVTEEHRDKASALFD